MLRTVWGDPERYVKTYFREISSTAAVYFAGDGARRDEDGYFWVMGRVDDVINVAGHRLGTDGGRERAGRRTPTSPRPRWSAAPTSSRARRWSRS